MDITPDSIILWKYGVFKLNATILTTWLVMLVLVIGSYFFTRRIVKGKISSGVETLLEIIVGFIYKNLQETGLQKPEKYIGFIGTLFIFIGFSGLLTIIPGYIPPTGSLSTTAALAICVFIAVPLYAIQEKGVIGFLKNYLHPFFIFLPFNIIADFTRTLALAIRLFGNTMSGTLIIGIIISISPLIFPVFLHVLDLITSLVQAYIFTVLATVYVAAATRTIEEVKPKGA
ncbi:MAG: F0F1 ATP synthase subunit A [Bacteriovoracaceae bacterium]|nr:F0F1 ATP synthase subunit A [Bacteriovoracaceae bacterium]